MSYLNFESRYDKFPMIKISDNSNDLLIGNQSILTQLNTIKKGVICFETYPGVNLSVLRKNIIEKLNPDQIIFSENYTYSEKEYDAIIKSNLYDDRVFGLYSHHHIEDFYHMTQIEILNKTIDKSKLTVVYGFGASLVDFDTLIMVSLTRWEIQLRYRKGLSNFKKNNPLEDKLRKYKRGYFVEWRVADRIKEKHLKNCNYIIDYNHDLEPKMISLDIFETCLSKAVSRPFRVVPYFDPGVWGGQWMKEVCNLDKTKKNFAWSFDGVPEENSVRFSFGDNFIELPAQDIVQFRPKEFMGKKVFATFGKKFPIRFDFLDTFKGGNLSLQVHPITEYIQETFGMTYTQDESYYILDAGKDAHCYLGVKENIDIDQFKQDLIDSNNGLMKFDDSKYINKIPVKKHDHLLIPGGTIHCSGRDTMVLEISACVYIFTFKLWDWARLGLDGLPRPVSLEHGFKNIQYDCDTKFVYNELVNRFVQLDEVEEKTGLHELEFIESRRYTFKEPYTMETNRTVNVCNLVDGEAMIVESLDGSFEPFEIHYAETFYIPATIQKVRFVALDPKGCKVIKAMVR
ncbi:MAG: class I mannose-6-phosphate isomerase [Tenericutes bacterium]|nr:class I mannose-6-phosphate isomerase [Mycoplasmatota bacterium]